MDARCQKVRRGIFHRLFAAFVAHSSRVHDLMLEERKRGLFGAVKGTVLEIGPGTGRNLRFLHRDVRWIGIEPNVYMHPYLKQEARRLGLDIDLRAGVAEEMEIASESIDVVVSTLALCSVDDPNRALREILRVLNPGGRFLFIEHVAAPRGSFLRLSQRFVSPVWKKIGDGCHPDRETWRAVDRAGFQEIDYKRFRVPLPVIGPHIAGKAIKPGG